MTRRAVLKGVNAGLAMLGTMAVLPAGSSLAEVTAADGVSGRGPHKVRSIENVWIPMSDGTQIAARLWLPEDADRNPVPALMEYIPYRKRDGTRVGDESHHAYLASQGYACIRPDMRSSGDSQGLPQDEYVKQEQDDGVEIIAWLEKQPWCTGKVGMFGYSWGGFSCLQVAARQPPALKAIITQSASDDRYTDDAHYTGGCINESMFFWGSVWTAMSLRPPDPAIVGEQWREQWMRRLHGVDFYVGNWLTHQQRDTYWKHGSINEDYGSIRCAVYAVNGWVDPYRSVVARLLANLQCPRKGLVGPWGHQYPQDGDPGPAIDWPTEALRWWDYWLKGIDTGIMNEPMYRAWMQETPAMRGVHSVPGYWVGEDVWPSARIKMDTHYLTSVGLERRPAAEVARVLQSLQTVGITAPRWFVGNAENLDRELPTDQRVDDARSLCFDSAPVGGRIEIFGAPVVELDIAVDKPVAFLIVRVNEVDPGGLSRRLSYGVLNLTQRNSNEVPEPLAPGKRYRVRIQLQDCAQVIKDGNRIRVAVSTTYWPMIWPSPEPVTLTLFAGNSTLTLPVRPGRPEDAQLRTFARPLSHGNPGTTVVRAQTPRLEVFEWDPGAQKLTLRNDKNFGSVRLDAIGTQMSSESHERSEILDHDPTSARVEYGWKMSLKRDEWDTRCEAIVRMHLTQNDFVLGCDIKAYERDKEIFAKTWNRTIARRLV